ncbi:hypothetical protein SPI_07615 [Niveomyces insectorum RCEF 264]|uniref:Uncharacterized protein n=1 Tax=Niveomyces insectorum RCEF 264 TaxID=1081102 RepID=A0A167PFJ3_9HYPO|nr:hypothetical protein SPI_07615 [Niveomyces insectorum RCEF 264]
MSLLSQIPLVGRLIGGFHAGAGAGAASAVPAVRLDAVPVHEIETSPEKRPRTLKHLLRANHANHALLALSEGGDGHENEMETDADADIETEKHDRPNPLTPALGAAYLLGASPDLLNHLYDTLARGCAPWAPSPAELADADWRECWGDARFQRAYVDFFEDVLAAHRTAFDWKQVVATYLWGEGEVEADDRAGGRPVASSSASSSPSPSPSPSPAPPLVHNLVTGGNGGRALVLLAYAFELDSRVLAMEALALAAVSYNGLHRYLDDPAYSEPGSAVPDAVAVAAAHDDDRPSVLLALLAEVANDPHLDAAAAKTSVTTTAHPSVFGKTLFATPATETALRTHWQAWTPALVRDPTRELRDAQPAGSTRRRGCYDRGLARVLATSHAARVLLPHLPARHHVTLLRQWWLLTLAAYVAAGRPAVVELAQQTRAAERASQTWAAVEAQALGSPWNTDADYLAVVRALREAATTWGDDDGRYLGVALQFVNEFDGWDE